MSDDGLRIIEIRAENVKRLKAARVRPDGSVVVVSGPNGAGKSSLFDAITYGLGGAKYEPSRPVRDGADHADVEIVLGTDEDFLRVRKLGDDEAELTTSTGRYRIKRRIRNDHRDSLEVRSADGAKYPTPQTLLETLLGDLTFDVSDFPRRKPAEQYETLRRLAGLDLSDLDEQEQRAYDQRTEVGRRLREVGARLASMPPDPDAPEKEESASELTSALVEAREAARTVEEAGARHSEAVSILNDHPLPEGMDVPDRRADTDPIESDLAVARTLAREFEDRASTEARAKARVKELERELEQAKEQLAKHVKTRKSAQEQLELHGYPADIEAKLSEAHAQNRAFDQADRHAIMEREVESLRARLEEAQARAEKAGDPKEIEDRLRTLEARNDRARRRQQRAVIEESCAEIRREHDELEAAVAAARDERVRRIEAAKMPLEGLSLGKGEVLYRGFPLEQASEAEQYRIATAIGMALNPKLRLLLIRNGSLLDKTTLEAVAKMATEKKYQVLVERVAEPGEGVGIVIEDGEIVS